MDGDMRFRYCPHCDGEYADWVEDCVECGAVLGWTWALPWLGWSATYYLAFAAFLVVHVPVLWDPLGQGIHDRTARTMVIKPQRAVTAQ